MTYKQALLVVNALTVDEYCLSLNCFMFLYLSAISVICAAACPGQDTIEKKWFLISMSLLLLLEEKL